jgi:hypothetical protein
MLRTAPPYPTGLPAFDARDDFARARRAHRLASLARPLRGRRGPRAPKVLGDGVWLATPARRLAVIDLDAIVGTVDPSPHFDERFRPASRYLEPRWTRVALAHRRGLALAPIEVVQGPDGYYVVDGRHRVSVARATGRTDIEAWVA